VGSHHSELGGLDEASEVFDFRVGTGLINVLLLVPEVRSALFKVAKRKSYGSAGLDPVSAFE
jgi:hypothetical protein